MVPSSLRSLFLWVLALGLCLPPATTLAAVQHIDATLEKISDGDTVWATDPAGTRRRIRLLGMDTPESFFSGSHQNPWAQRATDHLHALLEARPARVDKGGRLLKPTQHAVTGEPITVQLELHGKDKYGRDLAFIHYKGILINLQMTQDGWADPYLFCTRGICDEDWFDTMRVQLFVDACLKARQLGLGLFDPASYLKETAADFRMRVRPATPYQYIGDYKTKRLHRPSTTSTVDRCLQIRFEQEQDALDLGYRY